MTDWAFKRVKHAELQNHPHEFTTRTAELTRRKGQTARYQHIRCLELEGKRDVAHLTSGASGGLLRDKQAFLKQWEKGYETLLNAISPILDPYVIECIRQTPEHAPPGAKCLMKEVMEPVGEMANGDAIGIANLCGELLKRGLTDDSSRRASTILSSWCGVRK